jgi:protein-tyrosine phosphatase
LVLTEPSRALEIEGLLNLRDLGGLPIESGGQTRHGRLLRGAAPHRMSGAGQDALIALGVRNIVDLRTAAERENRPNPLTELPGMRCVHAPIFTDEDDHPADLITAADVYGWYLRELQAGIAAATSAIADSPTAPVLVHCHAGKDRTGVVVALILRLAGVGVDAIADDYALSGVQLADMLARDRVNAVERGMDQVRVERLFTVRREAMVETVQRIESEHRGAAEYLRGLGLDDQRIDRLRRLLVAPDWP